MAENNNSPISVRLNAEEKEALTKYAKEQDLTLSQVVRRAIKEFLQNNQ